MGYIGDLKVRLGLDTSGLTAGIKRATSQMAAVGKNAGNTVNQAFNTTGTTKFTQGLNGITAGLNRVQDQAKRAGQTLRDFIKLNQQNNRSSSKSSAPVFDTTSLGKSYTEVYKFITALREAQLISQQTSSRFKEFSNTMQGMGFSVDSIIEAIARYTAAMHQAAAANANFKNSANWRAYQAPQLPAGAGGGGGNNNNTVNGTFTQGPDPSRWNTTTTAARRFQRILLQLNTTWSTFKSRGVSAMKEVAAWARRVSTEANKNKKDWKDVARIMQGIVISQGFYKLLSVLRSCTSAMWDFMASIEQATVAFGVMLGNTAQAERLTQALQDFSAETTVSFENASQGARRLLAYGFKAESLLTVMQSITDATAASGDPESFNRIAKAIGQINTKGKLASQEMLQLTEAGIPAAKILREELGVTQEQLGKIGKLGISSDVAIQALLNGMNKRYAGAGQAMSHTWKVILDNIKDNLLIMGNIAFGGVFESAKTKAEALLNKLISLKSLMREFGFAGAIQQLVPPEIFAQIQILVANFKMLAETIKMFFTALSPVTTELARFAMYGINLVLPIINAMLRVFTMLVGWVTSNAKALRVFVTVVGSLIFITTVIKLIMLFTAAIKSLFIAKIVAGAINLLAGAIRGLILLWSSSPVLVIMILLGTALLGIAASSKKVSGALSELQGKFMSVFGHNPAEDFGASAGSAADTTDEFSQALGNNADAMDEVGDKADKTGKKVKNMLASFDEVFTLQDPDAGETVTPELDWDNVDMTMPEIPAIDIPVDGLDMGGFQLPSFTDIASSFVTEFKDALIGAGVGGLIGFAIGLMFGNPVLGTMIGAGIGAVLGYFLDEILAFFNYNNWPEILSPLAWAFDQLARAIADIILWLEPVFQGLMDFLTGVFTGNWELTWQGLRDTFTSIFGDWIGPAIDVVEGILDGLCQFLAGLFTGNWEMSWEGIRNIFTTVFGDSFGPVVDSVMQILDGLCQFLAGIFTGNWDMAWQGVTNIFVGFFEGIGNIIQWIEDGYQGMLDWLDTIFTEQFGSSWETIKGIFSGFGGSVASITEGIFGTLGGIIDFIVGVFTGDWERAWKGLVGIAEGIWNTIYGFVSAPINFMIDCVNFLISQLNKIKIDVPDWDFLPDSLQGSSFGVNIPTIPHLAKGGLVTKNTLAELGEGNKHEAVIPLENGRATDVIAQKIVQGMGSTGGGGTVVENHYHIGTLIADDRSLKKFKEKLDEITKETDR